MGRAPSALGRAVRRRCYVYRVSPVSRGRGKKNRSTKGPLGRRAAVRGLPSGDGHGPAAWPSSSHPQWLDEAVALPELPGQVGPVRGEGRAPLDLSWVTIERWAREKAGPSGVARGRPYRDDAEQLTDTQLLDKLRGFGIELDRAGLEAACHDALSAQEVASRLMARHLSAADELGRNRTESGLPYWLCGSGGGRPSHPWKRSMTRSKTGT